MDIFILVQLRMSPKSTVLELIAQDIRSNIGFGIIILESVFEINASGDPVTILCTIPGRISRLKYQLI